MTRSTSLAKKPGRGLLGQRRVLPGFGLSLGFTLAYVSLLVIIPLAGLVWKSSGLGLDDFIRITTSDRAIAAYKLSFGGALIAAMVNGVFGVILAWVLVRYSFPGRRFLDALVDFPLALPTAVAGITFSSLYVPNGWIGEYTNMLGVKVSYTQLGVVVMMVFISLPFVVRTVQPVMESLDHDVEEAAASLGASRIQTVRRVIIPAILPTVLTGVALGFARAVSEYGSIIFIAGNLPLRTEIAPLLIIFQLEGFNYAGAAAIALVLLLGSFLIIGSINLLSRAVRHA